MRQCQDSTGAQILRRALPFAAAGIVSVALITGYSVAFAQDITSDSEKLDQSANIIIIGAIISPLYGHWFLGGGLLSQLGESDLPAAADYAGSGVVHAVGGFVARAGGVVVGTRTGRFNADGSAKAFSGHDMPYMSLVRSSYSLVGLASTSTHATP